MMKTTAILMLVHVPVPALEPQPPVDRVLDGNAIQPIAIHTGVDTLLVFPDDVSLVLGKGLTKGEHPGAIHCQQAEDKKLVVLRQLEEGSTVVMQIVMKGEAYAFRLQGSDKPATIIRFHRPGEGKVPKAIEVPEQEALARHKSVGRERQLELLRLAGSSYLLKSRIPGEYKDFQSKGISFSSSTGGLTIETTRVARFASEDATVVFGRIRNNTGKPASLGKLVARVRIGKVLFCPASVFRVKQVELAPGKETTFGAVVIGDGKGNPLHPGLDNIFSLHLSPRTPVKK